MHPLTLWLINTSQFRERDNEDRMMRRQREARGREAERARDGRWAAALHRWAHQGEAITRASAGAVQASGAPSAVECAAA